MLFLAILLLAFYITKPFLPAFFTGAIIAYLAYPLYKKVSKHINKHIAAFVITVLIAFLFTVPVILVFGLISKEAYTTYRTLNQHNLGTNFLKIVCKDESSLSCGFMQSFVESLPERNLDYYLQITIKKITGYIIENVSGVLSSIPFFFLNFFVMMFIIYHLLKDGEIIAQRLKILLPLRELHKQHVFKKFHDITYAVFYGNISVAILQGLAGGLGFFVLGISSPILWGFVMMLFALIPYFGTAIVWLPAALNLIFRGYLQNDNSPIIRGVILIVYGAFVVSSLDNVLKPKLIGMRARIHPVLVLLGILGGLNLFGFIGLILGPVMLALLMTFVDIYEEEKTELKSIFR